MQTTRSSPTDSLNVVGLFTPIGPKPICHTISHLEKEIKKHHPNLGQMEIKMAARMLHFMQEINKSRQQSHIIYLEDFLTKFNWNDNFEKANEALQSISADFDFRAPSLANEKYFDRIKDKHGYIPLTYRLKPKVNASAALESMFSEGMTLLDCESSIQLARYLSILSLLQDKHGEKRGKEIFDKIFGHENIESPEYRRMLFSYVNPLTSLGYMNQEKWRHFPLHPLAYFLSKPGNPYGARSFSPLCNMNNRGLLPGDQISFQHAELYIRKHSILAPEYGLNALFCWHEQSLNQDQYTFFGATSNAGFYDEIAILEFLRQAFNNPVPDFIQYFMLHVNRYSSPEFKQKRLDEFDEMKTLEIDRKKILVIPGLQMDCRVAFDVDKILPLLSMSEGNENEVISGINVFLLQQDWLMKRKRLTDYLISRNIAKVELTDSHDQENQAINDIEKYFQGKLNYIEGLINAYPDCMLLSEMPDIENKPYSPELIRKLKSTLSQGEPSNGPNPALRPF